MLMNGLGGILAIADDLMRNEGRKFFELLELLADARRRDGYFHSGEVLEGRLRSRASQMTSSDDDPDSEPDVSDEHDSEEDGSDIFEGDSDSTDSSFEVSSHASMIASVIRV